MKPLKGADRKKLRGLAHSLNPVVYIGKQGVTESVLEEIRRALDSHELIKVKFVEFKEEKQRLLAEAAKQTDSHLAGVIGNIGILYREHPEPEKREIKI
jgi:RNA-binding protein